MEQMKVVPTPLFASVMGLAGLSLAFRRASQSNSWAELPASILAVIAATVFAVLLLQFIVKLVSSPAVVKAEVRHPMGVSFFPAISVGFLLVSGALNGVVPTIVTDVLWSIGTLAHLGVLLMVLRQWLQPHVQIEHVTPVWFIALVGNVVAPLYGHSRFAETSWVYLGIGMVLWMAILPLVMYRLMFLAPLPKPLTPTVAILIAPPAVILNSYMLLTGQHFGNPVTLALFGAAFIFFLIFLLYIPELRTTPFGLPWWATSFPLAAFTSNLLAVDNTIGLVALAAVTTWITYLAVRTLVLISQGKIYVPPTKG